MNVYKKNSFMEEINKITSQNELHISIAFHKDINLIEEIIDKQFFIASTYFISLTFRESDRKERNLLISAFVKNLYNIHCTLLLLKKGWYGSARILMRQCFEFLMIAKYSSISKDMKLVNEWENGNKVWLTPDVFNKLSYPDIYQFKDLWGALCKFSHATIYSQQQNLDWKDSVSDISSSFVFIEMFLECNHHLLCSHITESTMKYFVKRYGVAVGALNDINETKKEIGILFKHSKKKMTPDAKKFILLYKSKWLIKKK